jgi:hypothetical protein
MAGLLMHYFSHETPIRLPPARIRETGGLSIGQPRQRQQTGAHSFEFLPIVVNKICTICDDKEADAIVYPCGHHFGCMECLTAWNDQCGTCLVRCESVRDIIRVYSVRAKT